MNIIFVLIPLGLVLLGVAIWAFLWAVGSGQFDDLDSPAYSILMDEEDETGEERRGTAADRPDGAADADDEPREDEKR